MEHPFILLYITLLNIVIHRDWNVKNRLIIRNRLNNLGNAQIVDSLIQKGADVNVVDQEGLSAVHFAALNGKYPNKQQKSMIFSSYFETEFFSI